MKLKPKKKGPIAGTPPVAAAPKMSRKATQRAIAKMRAGC